MKTTLDLPDDLMREVKVRAAMERRKLKDLIAEAIRLGLERRERAPVPDQRPRRGITTDPELGTPLVRCPKDAPATRMSAEEFQRLMDDAEMREDLKRAGHSV